jgi:hypothetical protein
LKEAYAVRRTVPPSSEIEEQIEQLLAVGVGENPRESLSELAKLGARLIIQRAVEDEFEAWLGRASRPFPDNSLRGKPVAAIGASTGLFGAVWAQAERRKVLGIIGADVIDQELPIGQAEAAFGEHGELVEPGQRAVLADLVGVLAARAGALEAAA